MRRFCKYALALVATAGLTISGAGFGVAQAAEPASYRSAVLKAKPDLFWEFGESAGAKTVADASGNGATGAVAGAVTLGGKGVTSGGRGALIRANGTITANRNATGGGDASLVFWFRPHQGKAEIAGVGALDAKERRSLSFGSGPQTLFLAGPLKDRGTYEYSLNSGWQQIAYVEQAGRARVYLNGVEALDLDGSPVQAELSASMPNAPWVLGSAKGAGSDFEIDEVSAFSRALTPTEVDGLHKAARAVIQPAPQILEPSDTSGLGVRLGFEDAFAPGSHAAAGTSITWEFGDGETATVQGGLTANSYRYLYKKPGIYTVKVTVRTSAGLAGTSTRQIRVACSEAVTPMGTLGWNSADASFLKCSTFDLATPGSGGGAWLKHAALRDVSLQAEFGIGVVLSGGGVNVDVVARDSKEGNYRARAILRPGRKPVLELVRTSNGKTTVLASGEGPHLRDQVDKITVRLEVSDTTAGPRLIGVWTEGDETTRLTAVDPGRRLPAGNTGVGAYLSATAKYYPASVVVSDTVLNDTMETKQLSKDDLAGWSVTKNGVRTPLTSTRVETTPGITRVLDRQDLELGDFESRLDFSTAPLGTGSGTYISQGFWKASRSGAAPYASNVVVGANGTVQVLLVSQTGSEKVLAQKKAFTTSAGTDLVHRVKAVARGNTVVLSAKVWVRGLPEPEWMVTATVNKPARTSGGYQISQYLSAGSKVKSVAVDYESLSIFR